MSEKPQRFQQQERVAEGRSVVVSRAFDSELGRDVALKTLRDDHSTFPERVAAFSAASKHAARVVHANLVPVIAARRVGMKIYTVSPWVGGTRLLDLPRPLPPEVVAGIATQVAEAMAVAHAAGCLLRGLNPRDFRVLPDGHVLLLDLNKMQIPGPAGSLPPLNARAEVLRYLPTEARGLGAQVDTHTDVFCMGALILELITNVAPTAEGAVDMKPGVVTALTAQGPLGQLAKLAMTLASPRPDQRPKNVANLPAQLQPIWGSSGRPYKTVIAETVARLAPRGSASAVPINVPPGTPVNNLSGPRAPVVTPAVPRPAVAASAAPNPEEDELMQFFEEHTSEREREAVREAVEGAEVARPAADPWGMRSEHRFRSLDQDISSEGDQSGFAYVNESGQTVFGKPNTPEPDRSSSGTPRPAPRPAPPAPPAAAPARPPAAPAPPRDPPGTPQRRR